MKYFLLQIMSVGIVLSMMASPLHALQKPQPLATDSRMKTVLYSPNEVYKFNGHYGYQSVIEFGAEEEIMTVSLGDTISWQVQPDGSRLFIKPMENDALTNMSVITTHHTYHFELHADETGDIRDSALTFLLRFVYGDDLPPVVSGYGQDANPDLTDPEVRETLNFNYSIVGPELVAPIRIFDDGEFTFFEFRDKNAEVPAFFYVDPLGNESILNYRTSGDYIVVERVAARYTLRNGPYVMCIYNENMSLGTIPAPEEESFWNKVF